jgi:hypothetical protein
MGKSHPLLQHLHTPDQPSDARDERHIEPKAAWTDAALSMQRSGPRGRGRTCPVRRRTRHTVGVSDPPTSEQHRALLNDCWELAKALPDSGVLDRGRRPYRARRFERKLSEVEHDPIALLEYVRGMARRTSEGLESLVEYNRLDLSVETLIIDESKVYAPLFTPNDRVAAHAKLERQRRRSLSWSARERGTSSRRQRRDRCASMRTARRYQGTWRSSEVLPPKGLIPSEPSRSTA